MGLTMLLVTPCTDWYLVFTSLAGGNVELGASILPLNLLLQILLLPVYLMLFYGGSVSIACGSIAFGIVFVLAVPFALSLVSKWVERHGFSAIGRLRDKGDDGQLVFLCLAVISMFASESHALFENPVMLAKMLIPLILFFTVNFLLVRFIGNRLGFEQRDIVPLNFTTLARNSPLSLAIAVTAFPDRLMIALALVIGPLIELPSLGVIAGIINRMDSLGKGSER